MNKAALYKLSSGLYVVGVKAGEKLGGCVINTAMQVTSNPPQATVTISKDNYTHDLVAKARYCTVSMVAEDVSMDVVGVFGFQSSRDVDKFATVGHKLGEQGTPYLTDGALAYFGGKVTQQIDLGSHTMFVIAVSEGEIMAPNSEPMTYSYYRHVKNGTVPKNAPSYREEEKKGGWRCSVCGHIHEEETFPADFACPICRQPSSVFVRQ